MTMISVPCLCMSVHVRECEYHVREIMPRTFSFAPQSYIVNQYGLVFLSLIVKLSDLSYQ